MKQKEVVNIILTAIFFLIIVVIFGVILSVREENIKKHPYRIKVDGFFWNTKGIDSIVNNKIYFTDSYNKHIVIEGKYVIEER